VVGLVSRWFKPLTMRCSCKDYIPCTVCQGSMVRKTGDEGGVGDRVLPNDVDWNQYKDLLLVYPELVRVRRLIESVRQGLIIMRGNRTAEAALALFTSILKMDVVPGWREAFEEVSLNELLEDARLMALPAMWELPEGVAIINRVATPIRMRRIYVVVSSEEIHGLIVFGQPSIALLAKEGGTVYFGFRGIDEDGNKRLILEKAEYGDKDLTVDFWSVRPRWTSMIMPLTQ